MIRRIKTAWTVLTGKIYIPKVPKTIYVNDVGNPNRFVQLLNFRDEIIALDASGTIYHVRMYPYDKPCQFSIEKVAESPRGY